MTTINRVALERCIAVINGKGGVLKTTLVANLGGMLAAS
ncbi:ParA family protein, partial [Agromyces sp. GXS1127]